MFVKRLSIFLKFYKCKSCHVTKITKKYYTLKIPVKYPIFTRDILRTEFYQNLWQTHILHLNGKTRDIYIYISRLQCRMNVIHKIPAPKASHKRHCIALVNVKELARLLSTSFFLPYDIASNFKAQIKELIK